MTPRQRVRDDGQADARDSAPPAWAAWTLLVLAVCLQVRAARTFLPADLATSDGPAHFTTGLMLHDFLCAGHYLRPMTFAKCFYVHYPKVAFGHWPPVFYVIEAAWFFVFGTSIAAARWLCACTVCPRYP